MDNLGDWLYIVFLAIAVISSLFRSGKKKKQTTARPAQPQRQADTDIDTSQEEGFWEILEDMQNGPQQAPKPRVKNIPQPKPTVKKAATTHQPFLSGEANSLNFSQKQSAPVLLEEPQEADHSITSEDIHLHDIDEVRKAIIYSEILSRKY